MPLRFVITYLEWYVQNKNKSPTCLRRSFVIMPSTPDAFLFLRSLVAFFIPSSVNALVSIQYLILTALRRGLK